MNKNYFFSLSGRFWKFPIPIAFIVFALGLQGCCRECPEPTECPPVPVACDNEKRYQDDSKEFSGQAIEMERALDMIRIFHRENYEGEDINVQPGPNNLPLVIESGDKRNAAFLSKKIIDELFTNNPTANGIICYYGMQDGEKNIELLVTAGSRKEINFHSIDPGGDNLFLISSYCPPSCDPYH